jgi:hypothetical protein
MLQEMNIKINEVCSECTGKIHVLKLHFRHPDKDNKMSTQSMYQKKVNHLMRNIIPK